MNSKGNTKYLKLQKWVQVKNSTQQSSALLALSTQSHRGRFLAGKTAIVKPHPGAPSQLPQHSILQHPGKTLVLAVLPLVAALE